MNKLTKGAEVISLFCRININTRKDLPVRSSEMGMLIYLVKSEEPVTPLKIADFFKVSKPMVTSMIRSLSKKGYITKIPSNVDKRSFALKPTEKAIDLVGRTYQEYYKNLKKLLEGMGEPDYEKLVELIGKANLILLEDQ